MNGDLHRQWVQYPVGKIPPGSFCHDCGRYNSRSVCAHALVVNNNQVLMVKRAQEPMSGYWALPAGYLEWNESVEACAMRELTEETGVVGQNPRLVGIYSDPTRDEDGRQNVGVLYSIEYKSEIKAGTPEEVIQVSWFELNNLPDKIAFDHRKMIQDYLKTIKQSGG